MSSRVLRKLQGENDLIKSLPNEEVSDPDSDVPTSGAIKKNFNINRYDLLNQQSHSESEVKEDDDHETEPPSKSSPIPDHTKDALRKKKKKKKKKSTKPSSNKRSSEDNQEVDEVERSVREVNKILGETQNIRVGFNKVKTEPQVKNILSVEHRNLNPNNELKRIFGSKIVQNDQNKRRGRGRSHLKTTWLVSPKERWPVLRKSGISMIISETVGDVHYFNFEHSLSYQQIQMQFLEAVESMDPDNIVAIINQNPYHVDTLLQLSDMCKMSEDLQMAAELNERALYCLECAFHPLFNPIQGNCRLNFNKQVNRALYISLLKHLIFVGQRACYRTALEFCKLLLSLDPDGDPMGVLLCIDFYALRSREYEWLAQVWKEWEPHKNLSQLPNFAYSIAMAYFHIPDEADTSNLLLQKALIMFPSVLLGLLEKCSVQPDSRVLAHSYFTSEAELSQTPALKQLVQLYIHRNFHLWKEPGHLRWLEVNVEIVLDRIDSQDPHVQMCQIKRMKRYQGTPRNVLRHIILSDIKEVNGTIQEENGPILNFDPLPPLDSINLYQRPQRRRLYSSSNVFSMFFRSLLPTFDPNELAPEDAALVEGAGALAQEGAVGGAGEGSELRRSVFSVLDAMRELLANLHVDVPNDADVSGEDDELELDDEDADIQQ